MKLKTKIRILESAVIPVLLYGAQTWATTKKQILKLQKTQNAMLRSILQVKLVDKVKTMDIFAKTGAKRVGVVAKKLKYKFAGHMIRDQTTKWGRTLTTWVPHMGKRHRGRPITRWEDEMRRFFGNTWKHEANDRADWRGLVEVNAQQWATEGGSAEG